MKILKILLLLYFGIFSEAVNYHHLFDIYLSSFSSNNVNVIDPRDFGAAGDGSLDDTAAFQSAIIYARNSSRPIGGAGVFRIDGTLNPAGITFVGVSLPYTRNVVDSKKWGFVIEHNSSSSPLFQPDSCGMLFRNVVLYDPLQSGAGSAPKRRPPMFHFKKGQCVDFTIEKSVVVNAYDLFRFDRGTVFGDWRIEGNRIYAVHYGFDIAGSMPEVLFMSNNIWSPGVWQNEAVHKNGAMLAKWSGENGAVIRIDSKEKTIDGLKSNNEFIFSYRNYLKIESGGINVSSVTGTSFDQVPQPIIATGNSMVILTITGGSTYGKFFGNLKISVPTFLINSTGVRRVAFIGHSVLYSTADVLDIFGIGRGSVEWQGGQIVSFGKNVLTSAAVHAEAPATDLTWSPALTGCSEHDQRGAIIADISLLRTSSTFTDCTLALDVLAVPAMVAGMDSSIVSRTVGNISYRNSAGEKFKTAGLYDKP